MKINYVNRQWDFLHSTQYNPSISAPPRQKSKQAEGGCCTCSFLAQWPIWMRWGL